MARVVRVGVIGLGSIGQRMLGAIAAHRRFECVAAWDPNAQAGRSALQAVGGVPLVRNASQVIGSPEVDVLYVACPPRFHPEYAQAAIDAGQAVLCEKPLGVDLAASRALVSAAEKRGGVNAVNLIFGSAYAATAVGEALSGNSLGEVCWVQIDLHLSQWAQRRYAQAPWLSRRDQGGFIREVTTHYVYLCQRWFGDLTIESAHVDYPTDGHSAERFVDVRLSAGKIPICIHGTTEAAGPEINQLVVWGARKSYRIRDLHCLDEAVADRWQPVHEPANPEQDTYRRQLDNLYGMVNGQAHTMANFRDALRTQEVIESILGASNG